MLVILWEFRVRPGAEAAFEGAYGPGGAWGRLFARAEGWLGTELLRDGTVPGRYLTLDRWTSAAAYDAFLATHREEYAALDRECGTLAADERLLGRFEAVGEPPPP